ncbi:SRPBCC family protein [Knoellia subterranea]|nr:SRPBCC family protein [Knoellia subterranea]
MSAGITRMKPTLEAEVEIAATPERVWAILADPAAMVRHSPMVVASWVRVRPVRQGTRAYNLNRKGLLLWPMRTKVIEYDEPRRYAFVAKDNQAVWSFTLEPTEIGTRVVQRRETPRGVTEMSLKLGKLFPGGAGGLETELTSGMRRTLDSIKREAEGRSA